MFWWEDKVLSLGFCLICKDHRTGLFYPEDFGDVAARAGKNQLGFGVSLGPVGPLRIF